MASTYAIPRIIVLLTCLMCFTKVVVDQFMIYYKQDTNTAVSYTTEEEMQFPVLAFCPNSVTKNGTSVNAMGLTASEYNETMIRLGVQLESVGLNQFHPLENVSYDQEELYTAYNGICDVFIVREPLKPHHKIRFGIPKEHESVTIFFLGSEGDQVFVVLGMLMPEIEALVINSDTLIGMQKEEEVFLPKVNRQSQERCQEGASTEEGTFANCVIEQLRFEFKKLPCAPIIVQKFIQINGSTIKFCDDDVDNFNASKAALDVISDEVNSRSTAKCMRECTRVYPSVKPVPITVGGTDNRFAKKSMYAVIIYYSTEDVIHLKQYFIYGLSEFVSAAGGAMGMFLGWSFYQGTGEIYRSAKRALGCLQKKKEIIIMDK